MFSSTVPAKKVLEIGINKDAIRSLGFSPADQIPVDLLVPFLEKRSVPSGNWSPEKAKQVALFLTQIKTVQTVSVGNTTTINNLNLSLNEPQAQEETQIQVQIKPGFITVLTDVLSIGLVISHALLIAYDCSFLWKTPGIIGGVLAFGAQCLALLYSSDATKPRTSEAAVWFVFIIDFAAWFVHYQTFIRNAQENINTIMTGAFCAVICAVSFAALWLYRDSKLD